MLVEGNVCIFGWGWRWIQVWQGPICTGDLGLTSPPPKPRGCCRPRGAYGGTCAAGPVARRRGGGDGVPGEDEELCQAKGGAQAELGDARWVFFFDMPSGDLLQVANW